eukprot:CAMPEP_0170986564 /NCGR_PEP_ID=MMETSP0736-20130129/6158_1 /TAXON_ID=186038 /ORGANISM="Fragilariopsis kerguelensis, Strain L26-C5" /LENGTH=417 /DNA_ID=CAMNT_0011410725 /DNA_START=304 /DNA_END=1558 /DNA_ORIENTATION=-
MCLWSAASSYIRPALSPGAISKMQGQTKSPFGLGSSLFTIDLRSNSATFQWSPSAEEMTTEGVHSINGILTDWTRDNTLWVTSTSAGKTWEIDGRMPCQAVNTWSLTALCEASRDITVPRKAFLGENSLLTKPVSNHNDIFDEMSRLDDSPLVKVDTDYRAKGIHLFQKPLHKPRFQTDSLECIASPGIQCTEDEETSIATSSFFGLTDVSDDVYICGISSIRFPVGSFVDSNEDDVWPKYLEHKMKILCTLTMSNNGDIIPIQKPTGGMNINLFLSNLYPVPCNTIIPRVNDDDDHNEILLNKSKRSRIDCSIEVAEIKRMKNKSGLMISEEDGPHAMICNKSSLIMPVSHEIGRATIYAAGREVDNDGINDVMNDNVRSASEYAGLERTDLSRNTIQNTLKGWDSMSESEQDDYI